MKPTKAPRWCAPAIALLAIALAGELDAQNRGPQPLFERNSYMISFTEHLDRPDTGKTPDDMFAAAGVVMTRVLPTFAPGTLAGHLELLPGSTFGHSFQIMQAFDLGDNGHWSLDFITPNFLGFAAVVPGPTFASRTFNFSARAEVHAGEGATIGGMIVPGEFPRLVVFKARGPSLHDYGVNAVLADPRMQLFAGSDLRLQNDDWGQLSGWEQAMARSVCPPPDDPHEAMIVTYLDPGSYTVVVNGADENDTGVALVEMYLLDAFFVE